MFYFPITISSPVGGRNWEYGNRQNSHQFWERESLGFTEIQSFPEPCFSQNSYVKPIPLSILDLWFGLSKHTSTSSETGLDPERYDALPGFDDEGRSQAGLWFRSRSSDTPVISANRIRLLIGTATGDRRWAMVASSHLSRPHPLATNERSRSTAAPKSWQK